MRPPEDIMSKSKTAAKAAKNKKPTIKPKGQRAQPLLSQSKPAVKHHPVVNKPSSAKAVVAKLMAGAVKPTAGKAATAKTAPVKPVAAKPVAGKPVAAKPTEPKTAPTAVKLPAGKPAPAKPVAGKPTASPAKPVASPPPAADKPAAPASLATRSMLHRPMSPRNAEPKRAEPRAPRYVLEDQVGFRLRKAHQRASVIFNDVLGRFDVTPTQFAALAKLDDLGTVSQNQLGRLTAMDPATILGVVGRLVRQNLARARPAPEDHRLIMIELTFEGKVRVAEMKALALEVTRRTLAGLNEAEISQLNALLLRLG
jgi:DNA-binding MarR family transcriptional regulator